MTATNAMDRSGDEATVVSAPATGRLAELLMRSLDEDVLDPDTQEMERWDEDEGSSGG